MRTVTPRIKMCGITRVADAELALALGVDAIGLVFYVKSPRIVAIADAARIARAVGPFVTVVGLFVNASVAEVNGVLANVPLHVLQFHGDETATYCEQFQRPWIRALRMMPGIELEKTAAAFRGAGAVLLDSYKPGVPGGTGEVFDWSRAAQQLVRPVILAGGLNADNVAEAIRIVQPYAVDVSGGVESEPGKKDAGKMRAFVEAVRHTGV